MAHKWKRWDWRLLRLERSAVEVRRALAAALVAALPAMPAHSDYMDTWRVLDKRQHEDVGAYARAGAWRAMKEGEFDGGIMRIVGIFGMLRMMRPAAIPFVDLHISADTTNYDLTAAIVAAGFSNTAILNVQLTVDSGVYAGGNPGVRWVAPSAAGSSYRLVSNGFIYGQGGAGNGGTGGIALDVESCTVTVDNTNGFIASGGGGGGQGAADSVGNVNACQGGGGGGGRGYPGGTGGGVGGSGNAATPGNAGTKTTAGSGGGGGHDSFFGNSGGNGGGGGGLGSNGNNGTSSSDGSLGQVGGSPGSAINTSGFPSNVVFIGGDNGTQVVGVRT